MFPCAPEAGPTPPKGESAGSGAGKGRAMRSGAWASPLRGCLVDQKRAAKDIYFLRLSRSSFVVIVCGHRLWFSFLSG